MYGVTTTFEPSAADNNAVQDAFKVMAAVVVKLFRVPSALRKRWNATFWIWPKFSGQLTFGIVGIAAAAGH
jgi:hypothetical protein